MKKDQLNRMWCAEINMHIAPPRRCFHVVLTLIEEAEQRLFFLFLLTYHIDAAIFPRAFA